jgi:hypothetical protein
LGRIIAGAMLQIVLRQIGMIEVKNFGESFAFSMIIAVPIRAIAGAWIARHDQRWRDAAVLPRKNRCR